MKKVSVLFAALLVLAIIVSCQDDLLTTEDDIQLTEQDTQSEELLAGIDAMVDEALILHFNPLKSASLNSDFLNSDCPVITREKSPEFQIITLDFGEGCKGKDGKVRSGKIIVKSVSLENHTFERIKTFDNFFIEGKKVEGTITKRIILNRDDFSRIAEISENVTLTFPEDKGVLQRKATLTREYKLNLSEPNRVKVISTWGTAEITRPNGIKLTKNIGESDPLVFTVSCHRIVSGTVTFTTSKNQTWSIDYGDGECDNQATLTKNGESKTIKLK